MGSASDDDVGNDDGGIATPATNTPTAPAPTAPPPQPTVAPVSRRTSPHHADRLPDGLALDVRALAAAAKDASRRNDILFSWICTLNVALRKMPRTTVAELQRIAEGTILTHYFDATHSPSRAYRNVACRLLSFLYSRGSTRTLFDYICRANEILKGRKSDEEGLRVSAAFFLGQLLALYGSQFMSLLPNTIASLVRLVKTTRTITIELRYECLIALSRVFLHINSEEDVGSPVKEIYKLTRAAFYENSHVLLRIGYLELMCSILEQQIYFPFSRADDIVTVLLSVLEMSSVKDHKLRQVLIKTISTLVRFSQVPVPVKPSTSKKTTEPQQPTSIISFSEMFELLITAYNRSGNEAAQRVVVSSYIAVLHDLGGVLVETKNIEVVDSLVSFAKKTQGENDPRMAACSRAATELVFCDGVSKCLGEVGQLKVLHVLVKNYLDKVSIDPAIPSDIDEHTLVCILTEVAALIRDLGSAASAVETEVVSSFITLLKHPSPVVITSLCWTMLNFFGVFPIQLPAFITNSLRLLQQELQSTLAAVPNANNSFANGGLVLASLIRAAAFNKLYISYSLMANIFGFSAHLLKVALSAKDPKPLRHVVQVAWRLLSALMFLGPEFISVHMPQLLLIWRSVFQKPPPSTIVDKMSHEEVAYLLITKESALACVYSFCKNYRSATNRSDVGKRIAVCLNNTLLYLSSLSSYIANQATADPQKYYYCTSDYSWPSSTGKWPLDCIENSLKRRIFMCYELLDPSMFVMGHAILLKEAIKLLTFDRKDDFFAQDDALHLGLKLVAESSLSNSGSSMSQSDRDSTDSEKSSTLFYTTSDHLLLTHMLEPGASEVYTHLGVLESDPSLVFLYDDAGATKSEGVIRLSPTNIAAPVFCNARQAVKLFALLFPLQPGPRQGKISELLAKLATHSRGKSPQKWILTQINILASFSKSLDNVVSHGGMISSTQMIQNSANLSNGLLTSQEPILQWLAADLLAKLCRVADSSQFNSYVFNKWINVVITNTDPVVRVGAAMCLGSIVNAVGGLSAHVHLDKVVSVLESLSKDAHTVVHTWALHALCLVAEGAGLMFRSYVDSSLQLLSELIVSREHEFTNDGGNNSFMFPLFCMYLRSLLGVIGPELDLRVVQRNSAYLVYGYLKMDDDVLTLLESLKCSQQFLMFAPNSIDKQAMIPFVRLYLSASNTASSTLLRRAAITSLYQIAQVEPNILLRNSSDLEEQMFFMLDVETDITVRNGIKDILLNFLKFVAATKPSKWLDLCKGILFKTNGGLIAQDQENGMALGGSTRADDSSDSDSARYSSDSADSAAIGASDENGVEAEEEVVEDLTQYDFVDSKQAAQFTNSRLAFKSLIPRWHTRLYALRCVRELLSIIDNHCGKEHFDLILANRIASKSKSKPDLLVFRLPDLIRTAFIAATSSVMVIRLDGFELLQEIIPRFKNSRDPHLHGSALLEQYQAQIAASLTPSMTLMTNPEVLAKACSTAAMYVGSGITDDIDALSRVLRMLTTLLENVAEGDAGFSTTTGPNSGYRGNNDSSAWQRLKGFSTPNLESIVKCSVLTAWAQLQNTTSTYPFLEAVTKPYIGTLTKLWIQGLMWYAVLKTNTSSMDYLHRSIGDISYIEAIRSVLLPTYEMSWIHLMTAVMSLKGKNNELFELALFSKPDEKIATSHAGAVFAIYGLCVLNLQNYLPYIPRLRIRKIVKPSKYEALELEKVEREIVICLDTIRELVASGAANNAFTQSSVLLDTIYFISGYTMSECDSVETSVMQLYSTLVRTLNSLSESASTSDDSSKNDSQSSADYLDRIDIISMQSTTVPLHIFIVFKAVLKVLKSRGLASGRLLSVEGGKLISAALECMASLCSTRDSQLLKMVIPIVLQIFLWLSCESEFRDNVAPHMIVQVKNLFTSIASISEIVNTNEDIRTCCLSFVYTLLEMSELDLKEAAEESSSGMNGVFRCTWLMATCALSVAPDVVLTDEMELKFGIILSTYILKAQKVDVAVFMRSLQVLLGSPQNFTPTQQAARGHWVSILLPLILNIRYIVASDSLTQEQELAVSAAELLSAFNNVLLASVIGSPPPPNMSDDQYRLAVCAVIIRSEISAVGSLQELEANGVEGVANMIKTSSGTLIKAILERYTDQARVIIARLSEEDKRILQWALA